jgi:hypothetical protein
MYDMYPWDSAAPQGPAVRRAAGRRPAARPARPARAAAVDPRAAAGDQRDAAGDRRPGAADQRDAPSERTGNPPAPAVRALQVALDRRDNGGVTGAPAGR